MQQNELEEYKVLLQGGCGEYIEKKSKFIAHVFSVNSELEATELIGQMKKKYWDARHNCSAYVIGKEGQITRCSDDGEPSGTAGRPMLEVLLSAGIRNILVVVTRYFGGTLLGTGGLVRAYTKAIQEGLSNSEIALMKLGKNIHIYTDYSGIGKIQYQLESMNITKYHTEYGENVIFQLTVPINYIDALKKKIIEATAGKARIEELDKNYFPVKLE